MKNIRDDVYPPSHVSPSVTPSGHDRTTTPSTTYVSPQALGIGLSFFNNNIMPPNIGSLQLEDNNTGLNVASSTQLGDYSNLSSNTSGLQYIDTGYSTQQTTFNLSGGANVQFTSPSYGTAPSINQTTASNQILPVHGWHPTARTRSTPRVTSVPRSTVSPQVPFSFSPTGISTAAYTSHSSHCSPVFTSPVTLGSSFQTVTSPPKSSSLTNPKPFSETESEHLRTLSRIINQIHTYARECRRIQRGSPGAGSLTSSISKSRIDFNNLKPEIDAILNQQNRLSCINMLRNQFNRFNEVINEDINERGYEDGYTDRVHYLEKMNYECGQLKGMVDVILEGIWTSGGNPQVSRTLNYSDEDTIQGIGIDHDLESVLSSNDIQYQQGDINIDFTLTSTLCSNLMKFKEQGNCTDVTFCVGSKRVHAHRVVLAAQSEYFNSLLFGSMEEAKPNSAIKLQDVPIATLQLLIRYAYCGRLQLKNASLQEVLKLVEVADRFSFLSLKEVLVNKLSSLISVKTVLPLFLSAYNLSISGLQETCLQVADKNALIVIQSEALMTLPSDLLVLLFNRDTFVVNESLILDAVLRWIKHNSFLEYSTLVQCIRLTEMPQQKLIDLSDTDGMFCAEDILKALKIQVKPYWDKMRPRGRKDKLKNLFQNPECAKIENTVAWKRLTQEHNPEQSLIASAEPITFHGKPNLELCNAIISSQPMKNTQFRFGSQMQTINQELLVVISLPEVYLINYIRFDPYHNMAEKLGKLGFSYTLEVSMDDDNWKMLLDYSKYTCYGQQILKLPLLSVRYFRFKLTNITDSSIPFTVIFKECMLMESAHELNQIIRNNGIQVPRVFQKNVKIFQEWTTNTRSQPVCTAKLCNPVFVKTIRMKLSSTCVPNTVGDIVVYVNNDTAGAKTAINVLLNGNDSPGSMIEVTLAENTIVSVINIQIINIVVGQAKPLTLALLSSPAGITPVVKYKLSLLQLKSELV